MKHYLYRHIRLDKNEPFCIGIGTKKENQFKSINSEFSRAFQKKRRDSKIWNSIIKKTDYDVEILMESDDYEFIKEKEKEFIKLYGRKDLNTGCLANMTDGGDGMIGLLISDDTRKKLIASRKKRGRIYSHKIYQYDLDGKFIREWESIKSASDYIRIDKSRLCDIIKSNKNNNFCKNYYWTNFLTDNIEPKSYRNDFWGKVEMIDSKSNKVIKTFPSKESAVRYLGKKKTGSHIKNAIRKNKIAYGYKWKEVHKCHE